MTSTTTANNAHRNNIERNYYEPSRWFDYDYETLSKMGLTASAEEEEEMNCDSFEEESEESSWWNVSYEDLVKLHDEKARKDRMG